MREIVLDTETTGLDPAAGHRIVEVAAIELVNTVPTGASFHRYANPEREMPAEAFEIHGLSDNFLSQHPTFDQLIEELLGFIGDATLVIHNAEFDMRFLNAELKRCGRTPLPQQQSICTMIMARQKFPGAQASLDALCRRFAVDNTHRTKHGARLDAELLAEVYIDLIGARQSQLILAEAHSTRTAINGDAPRRQRTTPLTPRLTEEDRLAHRGFVATLGDKPIWNDFLPAA